MALRRRARALLVGAAVLGVHLWLIDRAADSSFGFGHGAPQRIDVEFVRVLMPEAPPVVAPTPPRARAKPHVPVPRPVTPAPAAPIDVPTLHEPTAELADLPPALGDALTLTPTEPPFHWPPSTRLSYALSGYYRGEVTGQASVEWLVEGAHYQVHLDVIIGLPFAPLLTRRMSSDGEVGFDGLMPHRYDEVTAMAFRDERAATIRFEPARIVLAGGRAAPHPPGVQDAVSQFVQFAWRFAVDPTLLQRGRVLQVPLALPRSVRTWTYDVGDEETLSTRFGTLQAVHLQPRRQPQKGGDLVAESWYAPSLQYLPVRILIRQDEQTYIDLMLDRLPQQATAVTK